jgi:hypothetical protein
MNTPVSDISCKKGIKCEGAGKKPTYPKFGTQNAPMVKRKANMDGRDPCTRINSTHRIPEPPHPSTFKRRGGVRNERRTSPMAMIRAPRSTTHRQFWTPLAFLPLIKGGGGGFRIRHASSQRSRSKRSDQRRSGDPTLLSHSTFNQCGAFPPLVTSQATSPLQPIFHFTS